MKSPSTDSQNYCPEIHYKVRGRRVYLNLILKGQTQQMNTWFQIEINEDVCKCTYNNGLEVWGSETKND